MIRSMNLLATCVLFLLQCHTTSAQFNTIINVPPDAAPRTIGSDTQLNLMEGGRIESSRFSPFTAGLNDGSSTNVEVNIRGGLVEDGFRANAGSQIRISGGTIGSDFDAAPNSIVSISGGTVDEDFTARQSSITITGGVIGDNFSSQTGILGSAPGSVVTITGGTFGRSFRASVRNTIQISGGNFGEVFQIGGGNDATLIGNEFMFNGLPTANSTVTLNDGDTLTGVLQDGSTFLFSRQGNDRLEGVKLQQATLLPAEADPIDINDINQAAPQGLRNGQSLRLSGSGRLGRNFAAIGALVDIDAGNIGDSFEAVQSVVTMSAGAIGDNASVHFDTTLDMLGGTIGGGFSAYAGSEVTLSGGSLGSGFVAHEGSSVEIAGGFIDGASFSRQSTTAMTAGGIGDFSGVSGTLEISGGVVGRGLEVFDGSTIVISGGQVGPELKARGGSSIDLIGKKFFLDGVALQADGSNPLRVDERGNGRELTGVLLDGSEIRLSLEPRLFFSTANLQVTIVPEPSALSLLGTIVLVHACRRRIVS